MHQKCCFCSHLTGKGAPVTCPCPPSVTLSLIKNPPLLAHQEVLLQRGASWAGLCAPRKDKKLGMGKGARQAPSPGHQKIRLQRISGKSSLPITHLWVTFPKKDETSPE